MPAPVILAHIAERGRDAALGRHGTAAGREDFRDAGGPQTGCGKPHRGAQRSEEHTSELRSLMRISYAVFCLKKKTTIHAKLIQVTKQHQCLQHDKPSTS